MVENFSWFHSYWVKKDGISKNFVINLISNPNCQVLKWLKLETIWRVSDEIFLKKKDFALLCGDVNSKDIETLNSLIKLCFSLPKSSLATHDVTILATFVVAPFHLSEK